MFDKFRLAEVGLLLAFIAATCTQSYVYNTDPTPQNQTSVLMCFGVSMWAMYNVIKDFTEDM